MMALKYWLLLIMLAFSSISGAEPNLFNLQQDIINIQHELSNPNLGYSGFKQQIIYLKEIQKTLDACPSMMVDKIKKNQELISAISQNQNKIKYTEAYQNILANKQKYQNQKLECELTQYKLSEIIEEAQNAQALTRHSIQVHPNLFNLLHQRELFSEYLNLKSFQNVFNFNFLSTSQKIRLCLLTLSMFIISLFFWILIRQWKINSKKLSALKSVLMFSTNHALILLPLLSVNLYISNMTMYLKSPGSIAGLTKLLFEFGLLHYLFSYYLFFYINLKNKTHEKKIWKVANSAWMIMIVNSSFNWFQENMIIPNSYSDLIVKIYILIGSLILSVTSIWFVNTCTQICGYPAVEKQRLNFIRYCFYGVIILFYSTRVMLSLGFGLDELSLGISRKVLLILMVYLYIKIIFKYIHNFIEGIQTQQVKFGNYSLQKWLGLPRQDRFFELTLLEISCFYYLLLIIVLPICLYFTEINTSITIKYQELIYQGITFSIYTIKPIPLFTALITYCLFILLGKFLINKIVQNTVFINNANKKIALSIVLGYLNQALAILSALSVYGFNFNNLGLILGGLSVGVGIGLNQFFGDLFSGVLIIIQKTIRVSDYVTIQNSNYGFIINGYVRKIRLLTIEIITDENKVLNIANSSMIKAPIINHTIDNENPSNLIILELQDEHLGKKAIDLIKLKLEKNAHIIHRGLLAPELNFNIMKDAENNQKNILIINLYLKNIENKTFVIEDIRDHILQSLEENDIQLAKKRKP